MIVIKLEVKHLIFMKIYLLNFLHRKKNICVYINFFLSNDKI